MQIPGVVKIVVNMGVGEAARDSKLIEGAIRDLAAITGQKPQSPGPASPSRSSSSARACHRRARHAARDRMWEFLDRLLSIALPRIP
jgi:large subunit ribosomal protein L5